MDNKNLSDDLLLFFDGSSAPEVVPQKQPEKKLKVLKDTESVKRKRLEYQERIGFLRTVKIMTAALVALVVIGSLVYQRVKINEYDHKIAAVQSELKLAKSENIKLQLKKESLVSTDKVRTLAETKLGMIQRDRYQIIYFDLNNKDSGKTIDDD